MNGRVRPTAVIQAQEPLSRTAIDKATVQTIFQKLVILGLVFVLAITLALMSSYVERVGPDMVSYGNVCGPEGKDKCYKPALKGGFPVPYLYDAPGVSIERQLAFGEDKVRPGALAANVAVYFALLFAAWIAWRRRRGFKP